MGKKNIAKWVFFGTLFVVVALTAYATVVMLLWNWLIPDIFNGSEITFWQSVGIIALVKILFLSSWGGGCGGGWQAKKQRYWKHKMKNKWDSMDPETKAAMKEKFMQKCGPPWARHKQDNSSMDEGSADQKQETENNNPK